MDKKIKFAVTGFGHIGKRHAEMISRNPQAELVAVADIDASQKETAEGQYKAKFFTSVEDMLSSNLEIDVVNVCTPNGLHASQAIKALERKCHVVVEKPMGLTKAECEQVIFQSLQVSKQV